MKFNNPIAIKKDNRTVGVLPVKELENVQVVITNEDGKLLFKGSPGDTFISLHTSDGIVKVRYEDPVTGSFIAEDTYDLAKMFGHSNESHVVREDLLSSLMQEVKDYMDNPNGSSSEVEHHTEMLSNTTTDAKARHYVESKILHVLAAHTELSSTEIEHYKNEIYAHLYGMGVIQKIDDDPDVGEIMVNGFIYPEFRSEIYYIKHGKKIKYDKSFESLDDLKNVFSRSIAFGRKELNNVENAMVEAMRSNRDRVNIIIPDASESWVMNIRKFGNFVPDITNMKKAGTINDPIDKLMNVLVRGKANIGIGGEMGTGKTTFVNYSLTHTEPSERKVVISSVSETDVDRVLKGHDIVILNVDDSKGFTFDKQIRASLRTTASRVIIPESRGEEFRQVYEANLKTKGNMFTAHALDDYSFLDMCVDMYMGDKDGNAGLLLEKIAKSIDIIIIMMKVGSEIRIKSISEVEFDSDRNYKGMNVICKWVHDEEDQTIGKYQFTGNTFSEQLTNRLNEYGVPMSELRALWKEVGEEV